MPAKTSATETARKILVRARRILDRNSWTKNALARDINRCQVDPRSENAVCYCAEGALACAVNEINASYRPETGYGGSSAVEYKDFTTASARKAYKALRMSAGGRVARFNDEEAKSKTEVLDLFSDAINYLPIV